MRKFWQEFEAPQFQSELGGALVFFALLLFAVQLIV
jgi:hypothetical protein